MLATVSFSLILHTKEAQKLNTHHFQAAQQPNRCDGLYQLLLLSLLLRWLLSGANVLLRGAEPHRGVASQ